jgi:hypothetical protein
MKGHPGNPGLKGRLVEKSIEAYILSLETINRLSIQYRLETFCYLICNAWEILLKAKILNDTGDRKSIYYKKQKNKPRRSLALRDCLNRIFPNQNNPSRRNIERIADLRDEAVHLVFSEVPREILCIFQASVLNYHKLLSEWFGLSLSDRVPVGMMSLVYDLSPDQADISHSKLKKSLGKEAADFLARYCAEIKEEFKSLGRPAEFSIGIEYKLVLTKNKDEADIVLVSGPEAPTTARIIEVPKDPSKSHPYRLKEVVEKLKEIIPGLSVSSYDIQCVNKVYEVKKRPHWFYQGKVKGSPSQYSHSFVEWISSQLQKDSDFFSKTRKKN